ncbi:hypothetical protein [Luteolibacter sp. Populi]|uniref:hypothetical protein n=1 Tax=Luteolibacter sp. Populi TaxID=3230487 RepID=UPI0034666E44
MASEGTPEGLLIRWLQRISGATYQLEESATLANPWVASSLTVNEGDPGGVVTGYTRKQVLAPFEEGWKFFRIQGAEN